MISLQIKEEEELTTVVHEVLHLLATHPSTTAQVVALHGDLGAGKTTFVQYVARALGAADSVTSPTFVIMKGYELEGQLYDQLIHIDAYRIDDKEEMEVLHVPELLQQPRTLVCIEWAERIHTLLPKDTLHVRFMHIDESRMITIEYGETD